MADIKDAARFEREWERIRAALKTIELRAFDREYGGDEVLAHNCTVHLEQMDDTKFYLGIETPTEYIKLSIGSDSGRAKVRAVVYDGGTWEAQG